MQLDEQFGFAFRKHSIIAAGHPYYFAAGAADWAFVFQIVEPVIGQSRCGDRQFGVRGVLVLASGP
jgi:hypothetical protein